MLFAGQQWALTLPLRFGKHTVLNVLVGTKKLIGTRETESKHDRFYARVLYSGQPVETIHGTLDWMKLSELVGIMSPYVPGNITDLCG